MKVTGDLLSFPVEVENIVRRLMEESTSLSLEDKQALELFLTAGELDFTRPVKRTINSIEGTYETRIFIGGSYKPHLG